MSVASAVGGTAQQVTGASYLEFLSQLAFLKPISHEDLTAFANTVLVRHFTPGQDIVVQRQYGHAMFVLVTGSVGVSVIGSDDKSVKLGTLKNVGDYFGEAALLGRGERTATVTAETEVTLLEFEKHRFDLICRRYPKVREALETVYHARAIATYMRTHNYLGKLDDKTRQALGNGAKLKMFQRGDDILKAGDKVKDVLVIKDGVAKATRAKGAATSILAYFNTHDVVGIADLDVRNYLAHRPGPVRGHHAAARRVLDGDDQPSRHRQALHQGRHEPAGRARGHGHVQGDGVRRARQAARRRRRGRVAADHQPRSLRAVRELRPRLPRSPRVHPPRPPRPDLSAPHQAGAEGEARARDDAGELPALPRPRVHDRLPDRRDPALAVGRRRHQQQLHRLRELRAQVPLRQHHDAAARGRRSDAKPNKEVTKRAIKCNLCRDYSYSNCVHECPRGAILRVDPLRYFEELALVMEAEQREAIEYQRKLPGTKQQVKPRSTWFIPASWVLGVLLVAGVVGAAFATPDGGISVARGGSAVGIPLGLFAAFCLFTAAFLGARKRMRNAEKPGSTNNDVTPPKVVKPKASLFPRGNLESWTQFHMMFGLVGFVTAGAHAGFRVTGAFTTLLMIVFALEVITGVLGQIIYMTVPKALTRLERHGLARLVEDLVDEEQTLDTTVAELVQTIPAKVWKDVGGKVDGAAGSLGTRFSASYDPPQALASAKKVLGSPAEIAEDVRGTLDRVLESKVRLVDVRAQLRLHRRLKRWLIWHVATATSLVVLLAFHIVTALTVF